MCQRKIWLDEQGLPEQTLPYSDDEVNWVGDCPDCGYPVPCQCDEGDN